MSNQSQRSKELKNIKNKQMNLINRPQLNDDIKLKDKLQCQNTYHYEYNKSISDSDIRIGSREKRFSYFEHPISFIQEAKNISKMINSNGHHHVEEYKNLSLKNENDILHHQDSIKSWIHTQREICFQSKANYSSRPASNRTEKQHFLLEDLKKNPIKIDAYQIESPAHKQETFQFYLILDDIIKERDNFLKICSKNRFYRNPSYNEPWKVFHRIAEKLIKDVLYSIQNDFINGVSKFVKDFLDKETNY